MENPKVRNRDGSDQTIIAPAIEVPTERDPLTKHTTRSKVPFIIYVVTYIQTLLISIEHKYLTLARRRTFD